MALTLLVGQNNSVWPFKILWHLSQEVQNSYRRRTEGNQLRFIWKTAISIEVVVVVVVVECACA